MRTHLAAIIGLFFGAALPVVPFASVLGSNLEDAKSYCSAGRFYSALSSFNRLTSEEKESGEACYVAGQIFSYLNQPDVAQAYYLKASKNQFPGYSTWGYTSDRLKSLAALKVLTPPFYKVFMRGASRINLYSVATAWSAALIRCIPDFLQYAEAYFGTPLPPVAFYFFNDRSNFNRFHNDLLHAPVPQSWHDGTGNYNVVLFCEVDKDGKVSRPASSLRTPGDVLHEYGHALCATIYGDGYLEKVPQWFNEGIADALSAPYYAELYSQADAYIRSQSKTRQPPSYETLSRQLYADHDMGYAFARMMVKEILGENKLRQPARTILEKARNSNFDTAILTVTGIAPTEAYRRVVARYWRTR